MHFLLCVIGDITPAWSTTGAALAGFAGMLAYTPLASDNRNDRYNYLYKQNELEGWVGRIESVQKNTQKTFVAVITRSFLKKST